ncbi:unnamed protein product [Sphenostylis stenocarpa]|uniref:Uncharacterized protein n=1 Tax=Sphenostylis stenocarpa TaxID=92480 RepID=A0AA86S426_9FABA|nr:unnamed protein product [Sphenostylis stenocarpa]
MALSDKVEQCDSKHEGRCRDKAESLKLKAFASDVILAIGYMHVMSNSFQYLMPDCLRERPWWKFPFTTFIAMIFAVLTLAIDSYSINFFKKKLTATTVNGSSSLETGEVKEAEFTTRKIMITYNTNPNVSKKIHR